VERISGSVFLTSDFEYLHRVGEGHFSPEISGDELPDGSYPATLQELKVGKSRDVSHVYNKSRPTVVTDKGVTDFGFLDFIHNQFKGQKISRQ
jgi:hypothetical protein